MGVMVELDAETATLARKLVADGHFQTIEQAVAAGLHHVAEAANDLMGWTVEDLRAEIQKGIDSGPGKPAAEVFDRLEAKYAAMERDRARR